MAGGQLVASAVSASAGHHGHSSPRGDGSDNLVAAPLTTSPYADNESQESKLIAATVTTQSGGVSGKDCAECRVVAATLSSGGHPGSNAPGRRREDDENLVPVGYTIHGTDGTQAVATEAEVSCALRARAPGGIENSSTTVVFDGRNVTSKANRSNPQPGDPAPTMHGDAGSMMVARSTIPIDMRQASRGATMTNNRREGASGGAPGTGIGDDGDPSPTIAGSHVPAVAFNHQAGGTQTTLGFSPGSPAGTLNKSQAPAVLDAGVRRLTPRECERLQAFPDDWTRYSADGTELADGPRYAMIGNAVTVSVAKWLGERIVRADAALVEGGGA